MYQPVEQSGQAHLTAEQFSIRDLAPLHGQRIALILDRAGKQSAIASTGRYEQDPCLGAVLRLHLDGGVHNAGESDVLITEGEWHGRIASGEEFGCRYSLIPDLNRHQR